MTGNHGFQPPGFCVSVAADAFDERDDVGRRDAVERRSGLRRRSRRRLPPAARR
jgi:hypothetical protein